ncbi:O-antigen ligase family protein [Zoogloea ramigera]|uniref:O-antigen ligase family protein n=1 Tax=Zoogloea ramigera TaxID=350 RepID=UPI003FA1D4DA
MRAEAGRLVALLGRLLPWLLPAFLVSLMLSGALARNLALVLMLLGLLAVATPGRRIDRLDRRFMLAAAVLPAAYVLNMAVLGWNMRVFDRPAHLLWAIPVYLLVRRCGLSSRALLAGFAAAGLAAGGVALLAKSELFGGPLMRLEFGRPMGPFSSPGPFGNYSAVIAMACLAGWLGGAGLRGGRWVRLAALLGLSGGLVASLLSETRSAWASLPVMALVAAAVLGARPAGRRGLAAVVAAVLLVAGLLAVDTVHERLLLGANEVRAYLADPTAAAARETSMGLRLLSWEWGWQQFLAHPLLGIGVANFRATVDAAVAAGALPEVLRNFNGLHNLLIDHLTTTGLVGTLAMVGFWVGMFRHFRAALQGADGPRRLFAGWGLMVLAAELVFASVGSMFASSLGTVAFTVLLAVCAAGAHPATPERG